jgi:hypothetical protein
VDISDAFGLVNLGRKRSNHQSKSKMSMKDRDQHNPSVLQRDFLLDFVLVGRSEQWLECLLVICSDAGMELP